MKEKIICIQCRRYVTTEEMDCGKHSHLDQHTEARTEERGDRVPGRAG